MVAKGFHVDVLYQVEKTPSIHNLLKVLVVKGGEFSKLLVLHLL